jgi:hypothetical protein
LYVNERFMLFIAFANAPTLSVASIVDLFLPPEAKE